MTVESTFTCQVISPAASARACRAARICAQVPSRCQRRNHPYTVCHGPYRAGTSRHGDPTRTRQRIPSMICRLLHFGGRPVLLRAGSSGSSTAHCASVRSNRPVTARVATRSPEHWSSWSKHHLPETSLLIEHRHARPPPPAPFETGPRRVSWPPAGPGRRIALGCVRRLHDAAHQHAAGARQRGVLQREPPGGAAAEPADRALGRSGGGLSTKVHLPLRSGADAAVAGGDRRAAPGRSAVGIRDGRHRRGPDRAGPSADPARCRCGPTRHTPPARSVPRLRRRGIAVTIPVPADQARHRQRRGSRGGRPPGLAPRRLPRPPRRGVRYQPAQPAPGPGHPL